MAACIGIAGISVLAIIQSPSQSHPFNYVNIVLGVIGFIQSALALRRKSTDSVTVNRDR
jgi:hypothetical protein